ncbi:hypothetical protein [Streptomyces bohaiensis]|uniref:hypothetical protein n=1 Tax=Streptomyces bohaiensis TaxID=1431344 RepID=UPI0035E4506D
MREVPAVTAVEANAVVEAEPAPAAGVCAGWQVGHQNRLRPNISAVRTGVPQMRQVRCARR